MKRIRRYFRPPVSGYYQDFTFWDYMSQYLFLYVLIAIGISLMHIFDMAHKLGLTYFLLIWGFLWFCGGIYTWNHDFKKRQEKDKWKKF